MTPEEKDQSIAKSQHVREWDGAYFCGSCDELLVVDDQAYCHKCGTKLLCGHGKGFAEYCAPCGRVNSD